MIGLRPVSSMLCSLSHNLANLKDSCGDSTSTKLKGISSYYLLAVDLLSDLLSKLFSSRQICSMLITSSNEHPCSSTLDSPNDIDAEAQCWSCIRGRHLHNDHSYRRCRGSKPGIPLYRFSTKESNMVDTVARNWRRYL